jgi:hypothetical protein
LSRRFFLLFLFLLGFVLFCVLGGRGRDDNVVSQACP